MARAEVLLDVVSRLGRVVAAMRGSGGAFGGAYQANAQDIGALEYCVKVLVAEAERGALGGKGSDRAVKGVGRKRKRKYPTAAQVIERNRKLKEAAAKEQAVVQAEHKETVQ